MVRPMDFGTDSHKLLAFLARLATDLAVTLTMGRRIGESDRIFLGPSAGNRGPQPRACLDYKHLAVTPLLPQR